MRRYAAVIGLGLTIVLAAAATQAALGGAAGASDDFAYYSPVTATELQETSRIFPNMAAFPGGGSVVLYGGSQPGGGTDYEDTWTWDGTTWTPVCGTSGTAACALDALHVLPGMGTDPSGVVLYGGNPDTNFESLAPLDDMWRFDGASWTELCDPCDPGARFAPAMAGNGTDVVLFGGIESAAALDDTWIWDGSDWVEVCASGGACGPPARSSASLAWDGTAFVLFGGTDDLGGDTSFNDTWRLVPGPSPTWEQVCADCAPPGRYWLGMTGLDGATHSGTVIVTGFDGSPPTALSDAWWLETGASDWQQLPFVDEDCQFPSGVGLATHGDSTMVGVGLHFPGPGGNGTLLGAWGQAESWEDACQAINNPGVRPSEPTPAPTTTTTGSPSTTTGSPSGGADQGEDEVAAPTLPATGNGSGSVGLPALSGVLLAAAGVALLVTRGRAPRSAARRG